MNNQNFSNPNYEIPVASAPVYAVYPPGEYSLTVVDMKLFEPRDKDFKPSILIKFNIDAGPYIGQTLSEFVPAIYGDKSKLTKWVTAMGLTHMPTKLGDLLNELRGKHCKALVNTKTKLNGTVRNVIMDILPATLNVAYAAPTAAQPQVQPVPIQTATPVQMPQPQVQPMPQYVPQPQTQVQPMPVQQIVTNAMSQPISAPMPQPMAQQVPMPTVTTMPPTATPTAMPTTQQTNGNPVPNGTTIDF